MTFVAPKIEIHTSIPDTRGRGRGPAAINPYVEFLKTLPAPTRGKGKDAPMQYASVFVPSTAADTITDPAERDKALLDGCKKLSNQFSGISKRIRKADPNYDFTFRKMRENPADNTSAWGLRVYRIEPGTDKGGPKAAAAT